MTRKDYILIAKALCKRYDVIDGDLQTSEGKATAVISEHLAGFYDAVESVASALTSDNPRFDREHFLAVVRGERELTSRPIPKSVREARAGLIPSEETDNYADRRTFKRIDRH